MVYQTYRIHPITINVALPRLRQQPGPNHSSLWRNRWDASCPIQCWPAGFGYNPVVRSGIEHHFSLLFIWSSHLEQNMTSISLISNTNEKPNIRASTCCSYIAIDFTIPGNKNNVSIFINIHNLLLLMELFIQGLAMTTLRLFLSRTLLFSMSSPKPFSKGSATM